MTQDNEKHDHIYNVGWSDKSWLNIKNFKCYNVHTTPSCMILDYPIFSSKCPLVCKALDPMDCQQLHKTLCKVDCPESYKALYPSNFSQPCKTLYSLDCQQSYKVK
jgi:hypothetical protein